MDRTDLTGKRLTAIELLMSYPDYMVAEMLGIRLQTLARWMHDASFSQALAARESEQARSLGRIARHAALRAASALCQLASDQAKPGGKLLLEILKASGAFEKQETDSESVLGEIVRLAGQAAEVTGEPQVE